MFTHNIPLLFAGGVCCAVGVLPGLDDAGAVEAAGVAAGGEASAVVDFFDFEDFVDLEALASPEAGAAALVSAVSAFFDLDDFLLLDASLAALVLASVESAVFLDLEDFVVEVLAVVEESEASVFLLFDDFLLPEAELSVGEVSSLVLLFFFFFDFVVLVSLWSPGCVDCEDCDACAAVAGRSVTFPATSKNAASNARYRILQVRFIG